MTSDHRSGGTPAAAPAGPWRILESLPNVGGVRIQRFNSVGQPGRIIELLSQDEAVVVCGALNTLAEAGSQPPVASEGSGVRPGDWMHSPDPRTGKPRRWAGGAAPEPSEAVIEAWRRINRALATFEWNIGPSGRPTGNAFVRQEDYDELIRALDDLRAAGRGSAGALGAEVARLTEPHPKHCPCEDCRQPGAARDRAILGGDPSL